MVAITELSALFKASLDPQTRKQAETILEQSSLQPGFAFDLLALTLDATQDLAVRLSSGVYLKNIARKRWTLVSRRGPLNCEIVSVATSLIAIKRRACCSLT